MRLMTMRWRAVAPLLAGLLLGGAVLSGCDKAHQDQAQQQDSRAMSRVMGTASEGYAKVEPGAALQFPKDHLPHPRFRQEWWYLTANLTTQSGEPLGLQWTQFRIALSPDEPESSSPWATNQLYMAHSALSFQHSHQSAERWARGALAATQDKAAHPQGAQDKTQAGAMGLPLRVWLDNWRWQSQAASGPNSGLFPASLQVSEEDFAFELQLDSQAELQIQGDKGFSRKNAAGTVASYYYSQPFIRVKGKVRHKEQWLQVSGNAWLDREWSSEFLSRGQQGWDWFALRLDDGSALMLFQLREQENKAFFSGKRMYPDGSGHPLALDNISLSVKDWQQTASGRYPVAWQLELPGESLSLTLEALNPNAAMNLSIPYWEGPITIKGTQTGVGYMELTGY
ncbi:lipocalin-like domain-containing protein [Shewanella chilikensis]|uniref:lipocalin-like domain-containing protein n=1 Tax=Shewanella chilikensis TaxID=558541 RepID=UPI001F468C37|nr:lipocalin-like domain-containing protein [Shewanella chilikensis]MCE9788356.1 carotenoid 1,2-hydratase [Shewanella chilikensis]